MALTTYPLNDVDYSAEDAELYHCTRSSGIYGGEDFQIAITGADRSVTIGPGLGWIRNRRFSGKVVATEKPETLDLGVSDAVYPRIDAVVIQFRAVDKKSEIIVKQGVAASSPVAPALVRTEAEYELHLCHVLRPAGSAVITASNVTDLRMDPSYCGLMADSVTQVDTAMIQAQVDGMVKKLSRAITSVQGGAGFLSKTVIWTNETGGTFSAQELSVNMSGYDGVELVYLFKKGSAMTRTTGFLPLLGTREATLSDGDLLTHFMRSVEFGEAGVKFGACSMQTQEGPLTEANDYLIPLVIYGVTGVLDESTEESGSDLGQSIFLAEYGVTTNQEVYEAKLEGRVCFATNGTVTLPMTGCDDAGSAVFSTLIDGAEKRFLVDAAGWTEETVPLPEETFRILAMGTATLEDIAEALREDKVCYLSQSGSYLPLTQYDGTSAIFSGWIDSNYCMTATVTADGWSMEGDIRRKVTEITEESDDDQIPTAKAVYDALEERETHSFDGAEILFDGDVTLTDENGYWVYYFDTPLGVTYGETYTLIADGVITTATVSKDNAFFASAVGGNNAFLYSDHIGVYGDNLKSFNLKIAHGAGEIHHLDAMYIPATFPRLGVAEVGQMVMVSAVDENGKPTAWEASKPLRLDADLADTYLADSSYGDAALAAIKAGRQILVKVPNADGGNFTAIYTPVLMHQVPNYANKYLYLFFLRDEKQDLSALLGQAAGTLVMPTYGELKMLLSQEYNADPLAAL